MPSTYSERKVALNEIAVRIRTNSKKLLDARAQVASAEADLTAMAAAYTAIVQDINAAAAGAPADAAFAHQKADKDKLVAEFSALKTVATNIKNAIDGVT